MPSKQDTLSCSVPSISVCSYWTPFLPTAKSSVQSCTIFPFFNSNFLPKRVLLRVRRNMQFKKITFYLLFQVFQTLPSSSLISSFSWSFVEHYNPVFISVCCHRNNCCKLSLKFSWGIKEKVIPCDCFICVKIKNLQMDFSSKVMNLNFSTRTWKK